MPDDRLQALLGTLLIASGGALAASLSLFLGSDSLQLDAGLVGALQVSWLSLFYTLAAGTGLQFLTLFGPPSGGRRLLRRLLVGSAFAAFLVGLALFAYVAVAALAGANAAPAEEPQETNTSA